MRRSFMDVILNLHAGLESDMVIDINRVGAENFIWEKPVALYCP